MRIAIVTNTRPHAGGVATFINTVVESLRSRGHHVDVVSLFGVSRRREIRGNFTSISDRLLRSIRIIILPAYLCSKVFLFVQLLKAAFFKNYDLYFSLDVAATNVSGAVARVLHAPIIQRIGGSVPMDLVCQGKIVDRGFLYDFFQREERKAFMRADVMLPNGSWAADYIRKTAPDAEIAIPMISAVDRELFFPDEAEALAVRAEMSISEDEAVIFFPSRIDVRKGPLVPLQALEILKKKGVKARLLYAGRGSYLETLKKAISDLELNGEVEVLGMVSSERMRQIYNAADYVAVTPVAVKGYEEPMPNCVLEAMACGTPVVASDVGGTGDVLVDKETGVTFTAGDSSGMCDALLSLENDAALRERVVRQGLEFVENSATRQGVVGRLEKMFEELL